MRRWLGLGKGIVKGLFAMTRPHRADPSGTVAAYVVVYDGWGTPASFFVSGRVLEDQGERAASPTASEADNIVDNLKALESDEVPGAEVRITVAGVAYSATADGDGVFTLQVAGLAQPLPTGELPVTVEVTAPARVKARPGNGRLHVHPGDRPFVAVISDVDDTVVKTYVTEKSKMLGAVLLKNAAQVEPVEGAAGAYRRARGAGAAAFFYVSGSPQNFYVRIQSYLDRQAFPRGPILLKNLGDDKLLAQEGYKQTRIEALLQALPQMRVILIGDSGEKDPEIYRAIKQRHPDRVLSIVIRKTASSDVTAARLEGMTAFDDRYPAEDLVARFVPGPDGVN